MLSSNALATGEAQFKNKKRWGTIPPPRKETIEQFKRAKSH